MIKSDIKVVEEVSATMGTYSSTSSACFLPDLQDKDGLCLEKARENEKLHLSPYDCYCAKQFLHQVWYNTSHLKEFWVTMKPVYQKVPECNRLKQNHLVPKRQPCPDMARTILPGSLVSQILFYPLCHQLQVKLAIPGYRGWHIKEWRRCYTLSTYSWEINSFLLLPMVGHKDFLVAFQVRNPTWAGQAQVRHAVVAKNQGWSSWANRSS